MSKPTIGERADSFAAFTVARLKHRWQHSGLSQVEVARRMGLSPSRVSHILNGRDMSLLTLYRLAKALDIPLDKVHLSLRRAKRGTRK